MVDANRNGRASRRLDHLRGLVDRFRPAVRRQIAANTPAGAIHGRARLAECPRDTAPGTTGCTSDEGHLSIERSKWRWRRGLVISSRTRLSLFLQSGHGSFTISTRLTAPVVAWLPAKCQGQRTAPPAPMPDWRAQPCCQFEETSARALRADYGQHEVVIRAIAPTLTCRATGRRRARAYRKPRAPLRPQTAGTAS